MFYPFDNNNNNKIWKMTFELKNEIVKHQKRVLPIFRCLDELEEKILLGVMTCINIKEAVC